MNTGNMAFNLCDVAPVSALPIPPWLHKHLYTLPSSFFKNSKMLSGSSISMSCRFPGTACTRVEDEASRRLRSRVSLDCETSREEELLEGRMPKWKWVLEGSSSKKKRLLLLRGRATGVWNLRVPLEDEILRGEMVLEDKMSKRELEPEDNMLKKGLVSEDNAIGRWSWGRSLGDERPKRQGVIQFLPVTCNPSKSNSVMLKALQKL